MNEKVDSFCLLIANKFWAARFFWAFSTICCLQLDCISFSFCFMDWTCYAISYLFRILSIFSCSFPSGFRNWPTKLLATLRGLTSLLTDLWSDYWLAISALASAILWSNWVNLFAFPQVESNSGRASMFWLFCILSSSILLGLSGVIRWSGCWLEFSTCLLGVGISSRSTTVILLICPSDNTRHTVRDSE